VPIPSVRLSRRSALALPVLAAAAGPLAASEARAGEAGHHDPAGGRRGSSALSIRGGDLSFTPQLEAAGIRFSDRGVVRPIEQILARRGATMVRLRVWTAPPPGYSDADSALAMARRVKRAGMKVLLNLHYSDFWADPGHQDTPAAWQGQDLETLAGTVYDYTRRLIARFARHGAPVDMVQVGNEVTAGMLWPEGQIYRPDGAHFPEFCTLLKAGIAGARAGHAESAGVRAGNPRRHRLDVMVHIDRGGDNGGTRWFYDHIAEQGVEFDVIGLSYYAMWHGSFAALSANLNDTVARYGKPVVVVETAYPWTLDNGDQLTNFITSADQLPDATVYPATPAGQAAYFEGLREVLLQVPDGRGWGFVDWSPEWIPGVGWAPGEGNPNDNLTMFDWDGRALPSVAAFRPPRRH
jgi:arabinogalactan endo-1,4-beta-galactosidase